MGRLEEQFGGSGAGPQRRSYRECEQPSSKLGYHFRVPVEASDDIPSPADQGRNRRDARVHPPDGSAFPWVLDPLGTTLRVP